MRITHHQLKRFIRETLLTETRPTFDLRTGDIVRHRDEEWRGSGKVVAKGSARERYVLVLWDDGSQQRHDPSFLIKEHAKNSHTRMDEFFLPLNAMYHTNDEFVEALQDVWDQVKREVLPTIGPDPDWLDIGDALKPIFARYEPELGARFKKLDRRDQDSLLRMAFTSKNRSGARMTELQLRNFIHDELLQEQTIDTARDKALKDLVWKGGGKKAAQATVGAIPKVGPYLKAGWKAHDKGKKAATVAGLLDPEKAETFDIATDDEMSDFDKAHLAMSFLPPLTLPLAVGGITAEMISSGFWDSKEGSKLRDSINTHVRKKTDPQRRADAALKTGEKPTRIVHEPPTRPGWTRAEERKAAMHKADMLDKGRPDLAVTHKRGVTYDPKWTPDTADDAIQKLPFTSLSTGHAPLELGVEKRPDPLALKSSDAAKIGDWISQGFGGKDKPSTVKPGPTMVAGAGKPTTPKATTPKPPEEKLETPQELAQFSDEYEEAIKPANEPSQALSAGRLRITGRTLRGLIREELDKSSWDKLKTDRRGRLHRQHRKGKNALKIFGVPIKSSTIITRDFYAATKAAENEYKEKHPEEYTEYAKIMQHLVKTPRKKGKIGWHWQSKKHGFGDADTNKISFPKGFDPEKNWKVGSGGMFVGGTGDHKKHGREMDWTWGSKHSSLPIPMNLQKIFNKHRISSSSKSDKGHQHHINFYSPGKKGDKRLSKALEKQYHVDKSGDYSVTDIKRAQKLPWTPQDVAQHSFEYEAAIESIPKPPAIKPAAPSAPQPPAIKKLPKPSPIKDARATHEYWKQWSEIDPSKFTGGVQPTASERQSLKQLKSASNAVDKFGDIGEAKIADVKAKERKMKITEQRLKKIIREEYYHALAEDAPGPIKRDSLKDILDHENPEDVIHATHHAWAGGEHGGPEAENLVMPIDQADAAGSERATREPEMLDITGNLDENMGSSEPGTSSCGPDLDHDGVLSPDELHTHFDLEGDGIVTLDDYADHILWHERNPEVLEDHEDEGGSTRMLDVLEKLGLI